MSSADLEKVVRDGYGFKDPALELGAAAIDGKAHPDAPVRLPIRMANRHGLVAGATGTGKTKTLQLMTEQLSDAGVPTFPSTYGTQVTRIAIATSSILAGLAMSVAAIWIGVAEGILALIIVLSAVLLFLAATVVFNPSDKTNLRLYKYASIYMLSTMLLIIPYHL